MSNISKQSSTSLGSKLLFSALLVASLTTQVEARSCYYDRYGRYRCRGLLSSVVAGM